MAKECLFCNNLQGHGENASKLLPSIKPSKLIVAETSRFFATHELFPIIDDPYFLIIPKIHENSFSLLSPSYEKDMQTLGQYITNLYQRESFVIFEHGEQTNGKKAQSIYHAHTHIIPTDKDYVSFVQNELSALHFPYKIIHFEDYTTPTILQRYAQNHSYLLFRQNDYGLLVLEQKDMIIPSQFFRVMMHKIDNNRAPFVNWKQYNEKEADILRNRLYQTFKGNIKS